MMLFQFAELGGFSAIQSKLNSEDIELGVSSSSVTRLLPFLFLMIGST